MFIFMNLYANSKSKFIQAKRETCPRSQITV